MFPALRQKRWRTTSCWNPCLDLLHHCFKINTFVSVFTDLFFYELIKNPKYRILLPQTELAHLVKVTEYRNNHIALWLNQICSSFKDKQMYRKLSYKVTLWNSNNKNSNRLIWNLGEVLLHKKAPSTPITDTEKIKNNIVFTAGIYIIKLEKVMK